MYALVNSSLLDIRNVNSLICIWITLINQILINTSDKKNSANILKKEFNY